MAKQEGYVIEAPLTKHQLGADGCHGTYAAYTEQAALEAISSSPHCVGWSIVSIGVVAWLKDENDHIFENV